MSGMLAGVETARRRRIHQSSGYSSSSNSSSIFGIGSSPSFRRSSSSLFSTNPWQRSRPNQADEKLGELAREAKRRLDERLRAQRKTEITRNNSLGEERMNNGRSESEAIMVRELRTEVFGSKKNGGGAKKLKGWAKLGRKNWEQEEEECAVCLEEFKFGENLVNLPCAHRFHSRCLVPWLNTSPHCPCCRMSILSE